MEPLSTTLAVLLGLVVRVVLPLALTGLIVWGLRRLDAHWEAEAERELAEMPTPVHAWHCWEINGCVPERREACPAYQDPSQPCWQIFRRDGRLRKSCLDCDVFRNAPWPALGPAPA